MSKKSRENKKAIAAGKSPKGKQKKIAAANEAKANAPEKEVKEPKKPSIPNYGKCCTCKHYAKFDIAGHYCKKTKKPTPRKSTCNLYACRG